MRQRNLTMKEKEPQKDDLMKQSQRSPSQQSSSEPQPEQLKPKPQPQRVRAFSIMPPGIKGPSVKQFEWFQMQTQVRRIIEQIVHPIQREIVQNSYKAEKLQATDIQLSNRLEYLLKMTTNEPKLFQTGVFATIQSRFQKQQQILTTLKQEVSNNTLFVSDKIKMIDQQMRQSKDLMETVETLKKSNRDNLTEQSAKFNQIRQNLQQDIQRISSSVSDNQQLNRDKFENIQKQLGKTVIQMENITKQFNIVQRRSETQEQLNDKSCAALISFKQELKQVEKDTEEFRNRLKQLDKLKPFIIDLQNDNQKILFRVNTVQPLITEAQINESLYRIMPNRFHPRIAAYEFEKYMELNEKVLVQQFDHKLSDIKFDGDGIIRKSQERNTRFLTKLKTSYYKQNGVDLDYISFETREKLLNDFDYAKLCQVIDELQQLQNQKVNNKRQNKMTEEDVMRIVAEQFENEKKELQNKLAAQIADNKTFLNALDAQLNLSISNLQDKLVQQKKFLTLEFGKAQLQIQAIRRGLNQVASQTSVVQQKIQNSKAICQELSKICQLNVQLLIYQIENRNSKKAYKLFSNTFNSEKRTDSINSGLKDYSEQKQFSNTKHILKQKASLNESSLSQLIQKPQLLIETSTASLLKVNKLLSGKNTESKRWKHGSQGDLSTNAKTKLSLQNNSCLDIYSAEKAPEKVPLGGFLKIPGLHNDMSTKYCRQSNTGRLNIRHRPHFTTSKSSFKDARKSNKQISDAVDFFSELKKKNQRYLH